jgi:hypothetical protein
MTPGDRRKVLGECRVFNVDVGDVGEPRRRAGLCSFPLCSFGFLLLAWLYPRATSWAWGDNLAVMSSKVEAKSMSGSIESFSRGSKRSGRSSMGLPLGPPCNKQRWHQSATFIVLKRWREGGAGPIPYYAPSPPRMPVLHSGPRFPSAQLETQHRNAFSLLEFVQ